MGRCEAESRIETRVLDGDELLAIFRAEKRVQSEVIN